MKDIHICLAIVTIAVTIIGYLLDRNIKAREVEKKYKKQQRDIDNIMIAFAKHFFYYRHYGGDKPTKELLLSFKEQYKLPINYADIFKKPMEKDSEVQK